MAGKKFTRRDFEQANYMRSNGATWDEISLAIGRSSNGSGIYQAVTKYNGDYDAYALRYASKRKTEQLKFEPPKMPRKIDVRKIDEEEFEAKKMEMAKAMARAIKHFTDELRDAGFRF